ncbi:MAG: DUF4248 domain-containing protein [Bacteroides sp.]|nr:DUF4248 domain-containing protein [Bacteroides sp.]
MKTPPSVFTVKSYGFQEFASFYCPYIKPTSAAKRLKRWIRLHPSLQDELIRAGWRRGNRLFTPLQVETLVRHFGVPH